MKSIWKKLSLFFSPFEWSFLFISYVIGIVLTVVFHMPMLSLFVLLLGIMEEVLSAKKSLWVCLIAFVGYVLYTILSFQEKLWGEVFIMIGFYIPALFTQFLFWRRNIQKAGGELPTYNIGFRKTVLVFLGLAVVGFLYSFVLKALGDPFPVLDAMCTVLGITQMITQILRQNETWLFWIVNVLLAIVLWFMLGNFIMVACFAMYFIYAIYGYIQWRKESQPAIK